APARTWRRSAPPCPSARSETRSGVRRSPARARRGTAGSARAARRRVRRRTTGRRRRSRRAPPCRTPPPRKACRSRQPRRPRRASARREREVPPAPPGRSGTPAAARSGRRGRRALAPMKDTALQRTISPVDGSVYIERPLASDAQIEAALARASTTQRAWRQVPVRERVAIVRRMVELTVARADTLGEELTRQMGRPIAYAPNELKRGFQER